ncbi:DNA excision repair protein ERCC-6 isoform X2 [Cotesia typhae]|uniref:DNA excision repair protein ERCC-6 isoform X2 n=1 Tax=Cotesia typhae TaxID=2053667 RepID=UPI003D6884E4
MDKDDEATADDQVNDMREVVQVRSEASIHQEFSHKIELKSKYSFSKTDIKETDHHLEDVELDRRVQVGEITPFEAESQKKKDSSSTFNSTTGLLDLEKYLKRQAEVAAKRKHLLKLKDAKLNKTKGNLKENSNKKRVKKRKSSESSNASTILPNEDTTNREVVIESHTTSTRSVNNTKDIENESGSEYVPSNDDSEEDEYKVPKAKKKRLSIESSKKIRILDDGDESLYKKRVNERMKCSGLHDTSLRTVDNLFKVPRILWKKLFEYQKVSVHWLWELHSRGLGGLLGDEMGLGKTVQVIAFFAGLDCSELLSDGGRFRGLGPTLIVCPATLLEQWVQHFHDWWPVLRVVTLHHSGTHQGDPGDLLESLKTGGVLLTSYSGVLNHADLLVPFKWHYVVLDEGHKIRNPQAKVTKVVKKFCTPHRLLLTGSPMQNSLKELWSLFDFILPGKLGTIDAFIEYCATPITKGGYANASVLQEATALQVATMLKDAISPYMLRRTKNDVQDHINLPNKNDQNEESDEEIDACENIDIEIFGYWKRSGKMTVVKSLLKIWKSQSHRVLIFTQSRQMLHVLEALIQQEKYTYLRLDGLTPMNERQRTIRRYNESDSYFVFISTTRVGGLGVNLTGANRVIIYDPDWNPATDAQARERAWRIGQDKQVTIYRLITAGTIEEKIYHRQIFKLLLSNRVLDDPRQRRLFQTSDLTELFNLNEPIDGTATESDRLFGDSNLENNKKHSSFKKLKSKKLSPRKEKKISALFEGEQVSCLIGRRLGQSEESSSSSSKTTIIDDDNYVLQKLFSNTNISSTLSHEKILSSAKVDPSTATPMQKVAREAAQESMDFVRQSRKWCWRPSWDPV